LWLHRVSRFALGHEKSLVPKCPENPRSSAEISNCISKHLTADKFTRTDASNTDPYAQKPEASNNWIETGPHVMIVGAKGLLDVYPEARSRTRRCPTSCDLTRSTSI